MTTETDPKPEAIVTPYEPAEPLPGVAPELRRLEGGYVRGDAHPGAGEPDWRRAYADAADELCAAKDELPDRPEGEPLVDGVRRVVEERDALRGGVERLKAAAVAVRESVESRNGLGTTPANIRMLRKRAITKFKEAIGLGFRKGA